MNKKYVVFKDDDAGVATPRLKKWIDVVLKNDGKAAIGLIGKYMKNQELIEYLNSLDKDKIEIFCHGYYHNHFPYLYKKLTKSKETPKTEFNKNFEKHDSSLKQYREDESKYLASSTVSFGPQGNIWNQDVIDALVQNDFKMMFSWEKIKGDIFTIPLSFNYKQNSLEDFIEEYKDHKDDEIVTLQFHHAKLTEEQFDFLSDVIDFLKNKEKRVFVTPSELLKLVSK